MTTAAAQAGLALGISEDAELRRVLFVIPGAPEGHSMVFARRQGEMLRQQGLDVVNFYLGSRTSMFSLARDWKCLRNLLTKERPDVIHAHFGTVTALFCAIAARDVPLVITYRGGDLNPAGRRLSLLARLRSRLAILMSQFAALRAARIICVSPRLKGRLWWRQRMTRVVPSGADTSLFFPADYHQARSKLNWGAGERVILFNAGRDALNKRLDLAEAAFRKLQARMLFARLMVLDGSTDPAEMPLLMNAADCLLLTSDQEGSPTVVQEALASNLPIVSVDVGDVAERLEGVRKTRIVARNAEAISVALEEILTACGRSDGVKKAQEFCASNAARQLRMIYREAVDDFDRKRRAREHGN